ncbi:MAG: extracellular solute-binding protein [Clostridia bacterium]|nr:extracellular solute-binding protein [Clostridia bacterium]MDY5664833.1 extracellular solute-binding protein [Blautia sp.]
MKKRKWIVPTAVILVLIAAVGIIVKAKQEKEIVLEFGMFTGSNWDVASANSFVIMDKAIAAFEESHPGVKIHYDSGILKEDYSEWCARKLLRGDLPDVFMVLDTDFNQYCSLGALKNLDDIITEDTEFDESKYFTTALDIGKNSGHQYALPYEVVPTLLFVNKSLLAKEGIEMPKQDWTWSDMYEICRKVTRDTDGDGLIDQFGTYNYNWLNVVQTSGASLFSDDFSRVNFASEEVYDALRFTRKIYELNQGQKVTQEDYNNGKVAFMPLTFAEYRTYKTYPYKIKKYTGFQWDCTTFPAGSEGANTSEVDALLIGISEWTEHEQLAWEFLKQLTYEEEMQMDIFRYSQGVSVLKNVTMSEEAAAAIQEDMDAGEQVIDSGLLCNVIEEGIIAPHFQRYEQVINLADNEISKMLEEDKNIDSTIKIFQRSINSYLKQ